VSDFSKELLLSPLTVPELHERTHFILTGTGDFSLSVYLKCLILDSAPISVGQCILENPRIVIFEKCNVQTLDDSANLLENMDRCGIRVLICQGHLPAVLNGPLIMRNWVAFHDVSVEFCKALSRTFGIPILADDSQLCEDYAADFCGTLLALRANAPESEIDSARLPVASVANIPRSIAYFMPRARTGDFSFLIHGGLSSAIRDVFARMIDFAYHASCVQSLISTVRESLPVCARFNWFLPCPESCPDIFPYAMVSKSVPLPDIPTIPFYAPSDVRLIDFFRELFSICEFPESPLFSKLRKVGHSLFEMRSQELIHVLHGTTRLIVSVFDWLVVPGDFPGGYVVETSPSEPVVRQLLHEDFFRISLAAFFEILFHDRIIFPEKSKVVILWQGKGVRFERVPVPLVRQCGSVPSGPIGSLSDPRLFCSLLFAAEDLFAHALGRTRQPEARSYFKQVSCFVPEIGGRVLRGDADIPTLIYFFQQLLRWFETIERLCPGLKNIRLPECASGKATTLCRYIVLALMTFINSPFIETAITIMEHYQDVGYVSQNGVKMEWLRAKIEGKSMRLADEECVEAFGLLLTLAGGCYFYPHIAQMSPVVVDINSPSSLLAFALTSHEFVTKFAQGCNARDVTALMNGELFPEEDFGVLLNARSPPFPFAFREKVESEYASFSPTVSVTLFFPTEFCCMMSLAGHSVREVIASLMFCQRSHFAGGKSDARFFVTRDNRFLIKTVHTIEMSLLGSFLPDYFAYTLAHRKTLLVKLLSVFTVDVQSQETSYSFNCIVMENLRFGFPDAQAYDFKGSTRNRKGESESVRLDGNYRTEGVANQLCLTMREKREFLRNLERDVAFLADHKVMDYSLVAIVCRDSSRVRFGIVDYCRAYTIDKALESIVKQTPLYAEYTTLPTIISPTDYMNRFVEAMRRYFHGAPRYSDVGATEEADSSEASSESHSAG
jgi:hypothetical protein